MAHALTRRFGFKSLLATGFFALAAIYLFASRPVPLQAGQASGRTVPVETVFRVVAAENDVVATSNLNKLTDGVFVRAN